ncbi:DUF6069 family protein [Actinokineospora xionganensis]|uniref:Uncharacterized protein n=1 Tax=Actinokineospora xionganensis TaxID=2684470 RepID=A0ABR7L0G7_9PSEU|nr:DUF6069 family protein [Actinokineospora xionganensis]MBC6446180.1 hypothetical protein [Actinokineospora xionganensis]
MSVVAAVPRTQTVRSALTLGGLAAIGAVVGNLLVLVVGRLAGADLRVLQPGATEVLELGAGLVALMTVLPVAFGTAALAVATRRGRQGWSAVGWLGLAIGLLTIVSPFTVEASTSTAVTLAGMHAVTGVVWFALVRRNLRQGA